MLHALRTSSSPAASTAPNQPYGALSRHELRVCAVPAGSFVHLGTTAKLVDFVASGASADASAPARGGDPSSGGDAARKGWRHRRFGEAMGLTSRAGAFVAGFHHHGDRRNVVMNSAMSVKQWGYIGNSSIVEHCHINAMETIRSTTSISMMARPHPPLDNKEEEEDRREIDCKRTKEKVAWDLLPSPPA
jgi:hypothetical protein